MYFLFLAVFLSVPFYAQGTKRAENTASGRGLSPLFFTERNHILF